MVSSQLLADVHIVARRGFLIILGAALCALVACKKSQSIPDASSVAVQKLKRPGFAIDMPKWPVDADQNAAGTGKYKVKRKGSPIIAEVSWQYGEAMSLDDMKDLARSVGEAFSMSTVEQKSETLAEQVRLHLVYSLGKNKVWMAMTMVECRDNGVMVTLGVATKHRSFAESLRDRLITTLTCEDDTPEALALTWPTSDLSDEFGIFKQEGSYLLGDAKERWMVLVANASDTVENILKTPAHRQRMITVYGQFFENDLKADGPDHRGVMMDGTRSWTQPLQSTDGPMVATAFVCPNVSTGYYIFAGDDSQRSTHKQLEQLSLRFGCPGPGKRPLAERPDLCTLRPGFCDELNGTDTAPSAPVNAGTP